METGMNRRVFVGSLAVGLPLIAAPAAIAVARRTPQGVHVHPGSTTTDAVLDHIARQLAALHNSLQRAPRGETARAFAMQLRTLAVYGRQIGIDATFASAVATLTDRHGRDQVLYLEHDHERLASELKRYGAAPDERLLRRTVDLEHGRRRAALDALVRSGLCASFEQVAAMVERIGQELDRRSGTVLRVSRQDAAYWEAYCNELWDQYSERQFLSTIICASAALPLIGYAFAAPCIAWQLAALTLGMTYAVYCWS